MLPADLVQLYARALVAIARADHPLGREVGLRLAERLEARGGHAIPLDDLLLAEPLEPAQLATSLRLPTDPFRSDLHPGELAHAIVVDGIAVVLAKGYVSEAEAHHVVGFATALGCSLDEVVAMSEHLRPWLGALRAAGPR